MGYSTTTTTMHMPRLLHRVLFLFPRNDNACVVDERVLKLTEAPCAPTHTPSVYVLEVVLDRFTHTKVCLIWV